MIMNLATLVPLALKTSIVLNVFALGLNARLQDGAYLFRRPGKLMRSLLSMNVVMPLFAAGVVAAFDLHPAVEIALVALAVSPIPPLLPRKSLKAGGGASYTFGLLVAAALLAIVFVPVAVDLLGRAFGRPARMSPATVAQLVLLTVIAPLAAGMVVRRMAPGFSERIAKPVSLGATILLLAIALPVLFTAWPAIVSLIGNGTVVAIAAFILAGLAAGHLLGGPDPDDRTVLAFCTAFRHPGVAIAIAGTNFPGQKLVPAAVLLYLLVSTAVSFPILAWRRRQHARNAGAAKVRTEGGS
jgi:BASS family bile acid:Na+ symporter